VDEEIELESLKVDPHVEENQRSRLAALRASRNNEEVSALLSELKASAISETPLMPLFIRCAENKVTLGEMCGILREAWGEYRAPSFI
jgi:methylmalonyl-CoA mutase N-terminal domain/subunit